MTTQFKPLYQLPPPKRIYRLKAKGYWLQRVLIIAGLAAMVSGYVYSII